MKFRAAGVILSSLYATVLFASNVSFLNDTAITFFRGDDKNLMVMNLTYALDKGKDNTKLMWHNPKTGSWGYAMPSQTHTQDGARCRYLTIFNEANRVTGQATYRFCKIMGAWKIV